MTIATYTFLPWLRRGLSNRLEATAGPGASRARLSVSIAVGSEQEQRNLPAISVQLIGPGDVTGIQARQIIRTEPRAGITDFEPNYLAAVEFYDEDFPWRYSPVDSDGSNHRLHPWLVLAVLKDTEFTRGAAQGRPLASFILTAQARAADIFPVLGQQWAWAHVHLNGSLGGTRAAPDLAALDVALEANPDIGYSRLLSPRQLEPNGSYTAFLVPAFEIGRKAGLGQAVVDTEDGTTPSWQGDADEFPIYFEWSFRTGVDGDFESLVRALVPRDMDPRVGVRDMDVSRPGFGIEAVSNPPDGLVGLEGALLAPTTARKGLVSGSDFVPMVETVLNAAAELRDAGAADPLVSPPIYGCWHAQVDRVGGAAGWIDGLNLDPRYRAAAGLGARVIRDNQEKYVRSAWDQIGDVITANHKIRRAQLASKASAAAYAKSFAPLPPDRLVALASPAFSKILGSPTTLAALVRASRVPRSSLSPALRKQLRPRGGPARRLLPADLRGEGAAQVLAGIGAGRISAAPPRPTAGGATLEEATDTIRKSEPPGPLGSSPPQSLLTRYGLLGALALFATVALMFVSPLLGILVAIGLAIAAGVLLWQPTPPSGPPASGPPRVSDMLSPSGLAAAAIVATPPQPDFAFASASTDATLPPVPTGARRPLVEGDSIAAADMRRALIEFGETVATRVEPAPAKPPLDRTLVREKALAAFEPHRAIAARYAPLLRIGGLDVRTFAERRYSPTRPGAGSDTLQEVMSYPDIKDPMYVPLDAISSEYFVPNLKLVPDNTISLLQTNQSFIESYLAGLNHEFARELLWREYPTDQRGSSFRQFWDVSTYVDREGRNPKELAEFLKDVPPLHRWSPASVLGSHNQRDAQGDAAQVVLIIRGNLFKRYPNAFIYAQKARWGSGARANRLVLSDETGELFSASPQNPDLRFPLYKARVAPDIHFVGFDLTLDEVRGDPGLEETVAGHAVAGSDLGWFFVLQESVGEPRFGLDSAAPIEPSAQKWDNLAWAHIDLSGGQAVDVSKPFVVPPPGADADTIQWGSNAADMAYIFYQDPVMVAVHGRNMLKNLNPVS